VTCQFGIAAGGMVEQAGGLSCQVKVEECVDAGALGRDDIRPSPMPRCPDPHRSHALAACSRRRPQRWRSRRPVGCSALSDESVTVSQTPALTVSLTVWAGPGIVLFTAVAELRTHGWRDPHKDFVVRLAGCHILRRVLPLRYRRVPVRSQQPVRCDVRFADGARTRSRADQSGGQAGRPLPAPEFPRACALARRTRPDRPRS
jgi:hypothetical protein